MHIKRVALFACLIVVAGCTGSTPTPMPTPTATPTTSSPVAPTSSPPPRNEVSFADLYPSGLGVAVTGGTDGGRLFKTLDAGRTWSDITPPVVRGAAERGAEALNIYRALFTDARRGWVVRTSTPGAEGLTLLQRTSDGGRTWVAGRNADSVSLCHHAGAEVWTDFADSRRGWLVGICPPGEKRSLARTQDGGITWKSLGELPVQGHVRFRDGTRGWLGESVFFGVDQLYETRDGGATWHGRSTPKLRGREKATVAVGLPTMFGTRGILPVIVGDDGPLVAFYRTRDDGRSWSFQVSTPGGRARRGATVDTSFVGNVTVRILDKNVWWVLDASDPGVVSTTSDAGITWATHSVPARSYSLTARDARTAWVVGDRGLFITRDGGKTWLPTVPAR